jgi:hypothetical protein
MPIDLQYFDHRAEQRQKERLETEIFKPSASKIDYLLGLTEKAHEPDAILFSTDLTPQDVVRKTRTGMGLQAETYWKSLREHRPDLNFERFEMVKILDEVPHLAYAAITRGRYLDPRHRPVNWIFYFANFNATFGGGEALFINLPRHYGVTFFALAMAVGPDNQVTGLERKRGRNGVLFSTQDPEAAMAAVTRLRDMQTRK